MDASFVERFVGEEIKDPFGRVVGTLVSIYSDVDGNVEGVEIALGGNTFTTVPAYRLLKDGDNLYVMPEWMAEARDVYMKLERALKRIKALEMMARSGDFNADIVSQAKKKVEQQMSKLKERLTNARKMIKERLNELEDQTLQMEKALVNLQMSYFAGEVDERRYKQAASSIRQQKDIALEEKKALKEWMEKLERLEREPMKEEEEPPVQSVTGVTTTTSPVVIDLSD